MPSYMGGRHNHWRELTLETLSRKGDDNVVPSNTIPPLTAPPPPILLEKVMITTSPIRLYNKDVMLFCGAIAAAVSSLECLLLKLYFKFL